LILKGVRNAFLLHPSRVIIYLTDQALVREIIAVPKHEGARPDTNTRRLQRRNGKPRETESRAQVNSEVGGLGSSMLIEIGHVEALFRYPVKSMGGERLEVAELGWYGLEGDRRLAFRRMDDRGGMPWLTASKLPTCSCLLRTPVKVALSETFLGIFARRTVGRCPSSGRNWPRRSDVGTVLPCR
jgi:hypothetical protein